MDNFYTVTVYEKGAEVVRMYEALLGRDGFRKGMDLYFKRHDGAAVTCDDFLAAMADANGVDLSAFGAWYSQAGTPELSVKTEYNAGAQTLTLRCAQRTPPTPGQAAKVPLLLPIAVGLLGADGADLALTLAPGTDATLDATRTTAVLRMRAAEATFVFTGVKARPVPSLLRGFSAPVKLTSDVSDDDLLFLAAHDSDPFNRWEAGQCLARGLILRLLAAHAAAPAGAKPPVALPPAFTAALEALLVAAEAPGADKAFLARCLSLPGEGELSELQTPVADPDAIHAVRRGVVRCVAAALRPRLLSALAANSAPRYANDGPARAARSLKNTALAHLATLEEPALAEDAAARFAAADNMTDQLAALAALCAWDCPQRAPALAAFAAQWAHDPLVMNKWLSLQAASDVPGNVNRVRELMSHPAFDIRNPNKVYSLIGGFCSCAVNFHARDGSGYALLADVVLQLDGMNPQVAARMVGGFSRWRKYDEQRQALMRAQLERVAAHPGLSENVFEIATKSLAA
jgi:aminopeptidase N